MLMTAVVRILLLIVASTGYARGRADAPVQVVEFSDFGCRYCAEFARDVLPAVDREFIAGGRVRWVLVPVASASTPHALTAARTAECAARQGRAWEMHDVLFARRREWLQLRDPRPRFAAYARELKLDGRRFVACEADPRTAATVAGYRRLARASGVRIAPTLLVNGRRFEGALPLAELRVVLRDAARSR